MRELKLSGTTVRSCDQFDRSTGNANAAGLRQRLEGIGNQQASFPGREQGSPIVLIAPQRGQGEMYGGQPSPIEGRARKVS